MTAWQIVQALLVAALTTVPFLGGLHATADEGPPSAATPRTSPARKRTRAARRSGPAGAGFAPRSPAPAPRPDGRGVPGATTPSTVPVGLHRRRVHG